MLPPLSDGQRRSYGDHSDDFLTLCQLTVAFKKQKSNFILSARRMACLLERKPLDR
jgi:hypothetical protein